ncbi:MAG: hypothetical protein ACHP7P_14740 [Terriglobales bacterium]
MSTNDQGGASRGNARTTQLSRAAMQLVDYIQLLTPDERAELFKTHAEQIEALLLMLDGLVLRGELPARNGTDTPHERTSARAHVKHLTTRVGSRMTQ